MGRTSRGDNKSKQKRQQTILRLIQENPISRQETLLEYLSKEGFDATQATISRDIREMNLVIFFVPESEFISVPVRVEFFSELFCLFISLFIEYNSKITVFTAEIERFPLCFYFIFFQLIGTVL